MSKYEASSLSESTHTCHAPLRDLPLGLPPTAPIPSSVEVHNEGIYRGLPTYDSSVHGKTAIVAGANGISGTHMMRVMKAHPKIWKRVYAFSRRPAMEDFPSNFSHHAVDLFNATPETVAENIKREGIKDVDLIFFYVYMPAPPTSKEALFSDTEQLAVLNGTIIVNFLEGLWLAGLRPKRILLQTGGKGYGVHFGPVRHQLMEDDRPNQRFYHESNFYFSHEDALWKFCQKHQIEWVESRPAYILGYVKDNILNPFLPMMIYAAITKYTGGKHLVYPGNRKSWHHAGDSEPLPLPTQKELKRLAVATAYHNALQQEWSMLSPHTGNQAFHVADGQVFYWNRLWTALANMFDLETGPPPADDDPGAKWTEYEMDCDAALDFKYRAKTSYLFLLSEWAERAETQAAWSKMADEYGLDRTWMKQIYAFSVSDFTILNWWPLQYDLDKLRRFGYYGSVSTFDALQEVYDLAVKNKIFPELKR